ncbi:LCP family protein [Amycolatopsis nigrescens]|uniref:LCP family protein n=1 Tax=Amycolatopsis nigrescens TaxID=381445 RepID=UPI000382B48D|nr:LCP family protein [Amycolatopsis nigrescens]
MSGGDDAEREVDRPLTGELDGDQEELDESAVPSGTGAAADKAGPPTFEQHLPLLTHGKRPTPTPYPRHRAPEPPAAPGKSGGRITGKVLVALLSVVALAATGYAYLTYDQFKSNVHTTDALLGGDDGRPAPPADDGANDILLVGTDARTDMQGNPLPLNVLKELRTEEKAGINTDTLIVLRIPKNGGKPVGLSLPRDTWLNVPHGGQGKVNSVYGAAKIAAANRERRGGERDAAKVERDSDQAGRRALVQAVQDFTQIRVDHYAEVNLLGFYLLTEALGGVPVCLKHATEDKDSGADFRAGRQTVSGGEALSFVRQRKNLPRGDLDRIVRQQAFLSSALNKVLSAGTLTSPSMLNQLTDAVRRSIVLDEQLDPLEFAEQAKGIASGDVQFETIPVVTVGGRSPDGQSIVEVDPSVVRQFVQSKVGRGEVQGGGGGSPGGGPAGAPRLAQDGPACVN